MPEHLHPDRIRAAFASAMSEMYRREVPLYSDLLRVVREVNAAVLAPEGVAAILGHGEVARLEAERHGAIRLGTARELNEVGRVFAVMGMAPVGYYDLAAAGVPVHATAFRPTDAVSLAASPFRVFTSLLRLELIADESLRRRAAEILSRRRILTPLALELLGAAERAGGLTAREAQVFVTEVLKTFSWNNRVAVGHDTYRRLDEAHRLVADVVAFSGPHINHLTPRVLDIDMAQAEMIRRGFAAKTNIEGPPRRRVPILLRQTSFKAQAEPIDFGEPGLSATHTARFGEIEQRGAALTAEGRRLYDDLLAQVRATLPRADGRAQRDVLAEVFAAFPDDLATLRRRGLIFLDYRSTAAGRAAAAASGVDDPAEWLERGWATAAPLLYEDFLPVSAAGIFQSNLGDAPPLPAANKASRAAFEVALGKPVLDELALYAEAESRSIARTHREISSGAVAELAHVLNAD